MREGAVKPGGRLVAGLAMLAGALAGCMAGQQVPSYNLAFPGNPHVGKELIVSKGCGSCHVIPGIYQARGLVGPPLYFFGRRTMIAGELPNTPQNLVRWLRNPPEVEPGTAMPDLGLNQDQAQDIAAYLDTLH
jgi:cytochrome c